MTSGDSGVWICAQSTAETAAEAFQPADTSSSNSHPGYHSAALHEIVVQV